MRKINAVLTAVVVPAALFAASCTVGPDYKPPQTKSPAQFSEIGSATRPTTQPAETSQALPDYRRWWTAFGDNRLNSLIDRAVKGNPDLIAAEARIREARANRGVAASAYYPQVNANGSYSHSRQSSNQPAAAAFGGGGGFPGQETDMWQAGFDASWEIDVFGGTRRAVEAADASIQAAIEDRRDVQVSLLAEVAINYVQLRGAQYDLVIVRHNLQSQEQTLALTRRKAEGGLIPYLDVAQQEAQVATTASQIPALETQIRQAIHRLGILLGQDPGALSEELTPEAPIPVGPSSVPPGLPSELLRRRPDVRRAERQLAAATAQIGVATADLFPKFSITGALGTQAANFRQLFDYSSRTYSIAPGVTWDIFDAGRVKSNIDVQNARQVQALAAYVKTVLQSLQDVDDALVAYNREQVRLQSLRQAVQANERAVELSMELFEKGSKDFLSVLDAQRNLFAAQDAMARSEQQVAADLIALYKALGGGWE
ncbi:MAG: efflux transporter outer membrane subunit [Tepidisphaeraceae bacterium]|jgi:NodT family efflux transporter outer membrane factor (OMF) lipoprotein